MTQIKRNLTWQFANAGGAATCIFEGVVGEDAGLDELVPEIQGPVRFDMRGISRINSTGVREWLKFIDAITARGPHHLVSCSVPIVAQLNMIDNFRGGAIVDSVMAPYFCEACGYESATEVPIEQQKPVLPARTCPECSSEMTLDEVEARYFYFLTP